ncbi:M48 family metallopeptidase [Caulobacter sp. RHG1]|uniref:tetratricopeptide repeat protein n=1 Tax=Caulobacter sp. (strain RHG1) TaxID=2545762 RepID=UPI0015577246|nr:M48 family metallopeptidase [Caulobacter sp. RHG1]NQE64093.1 putative Zn-dependent protease, contains TPR repeats [Caulobacter sp. RHG1]
MTSRSGRVGRRFGVAAAALSVLASGAVVTSASAQSLIRDTEIEEILHHDSAPIFAAAGLEPKNVRILIVGDKSLNAFATPGLQMGLNTGLILQTENPNQLRGVIAHETGHLAGGHPIRSDEMMKAGLKPMILTMGLGILAALAGSVDGGAMLIANSQYAGALGALGYSREQESRADQAGAGFLEATNQSGRGLVEFFDNFRYQEVFDQARRFAYFRSHPLSSERIEVLRSRVERQPHYTAVDTPEDLAQHEVMKAKLEGFLNPQVALMKYKETDTGFPARYARAIAYYQMKDPDRALSLIDGLLADHPDNPYLWELKGQVLFEFNRVDQAEEPQRKSVALKPDAALLRVNLGQTLIGLKDPKKVEEGVQELKRSLLNEPDNSVAWRLLAQAYDTQKKDGEARLATAEQYYSLGAVSEAKVFAMRARELLTKNTPDWRRATDIVLASRPSNQELKDLAKDGLAPSPAGH